MKPVDLTTQVGWDRQGHPVLAGQLLPWAYRQLRAAEACTQAVETALTLFEAQEDASVPAEQVAEVAERLREAQRAWGRM